MIDIARGSVTATIPVDQKPVLVAIAPDSHHAYITNNESNNVSTVDVGSG
jgi:DNA-binding beta-propeller fold protein YncE